MAKIPNDVLNMNRIDGIIISVTGYLYSPGKLSIKKQLSSKSYMDFQIYMAGQIADEYVRAIDTQRYAKGSHAWKPLNIHYRTWKQKHHLSTNIWEATGHMKKSIKVFRKGSFIGVGFKQNDLYPKSFAKINDIARYLEYGGRKDPNRPPSRPLWRPLLERMRKDVSVYFKRYQKELKAQGKQFLYL